MRARLQTPASAVAARALAREARGNSQGGEMSTTQRAYTDETLPQLLSLIEGADSVELKVTVAEHAHAAAVRRARARSARGADPPGVLLRHPRPRAEQAGRRRAGAPRPEAPRRLGDQAAAGRPRRAAQAPAPVARRSRSRSTRCPAASSARRDEGDARRRRRPRGRCAGSGRSASSSRRSSGGSTRSMRPTGVALDDLAVLGPVFVLKLKCMAEGFDRRLVAEMWLYPDGSRILELSTKCAPRRGVPGRGRDARLPAVARARPRR